MKLFILALFLTTLTSCAIVGSKEALKVENNSAWKTVKTGHGDYHSYRCEKISFSIDEIVFKTKYDSYGPVIPIIPSGKERNFENTNLNLKIEIVGYTKAVNFKIEDLSVHVFSDNKELALVDRNLSKITEKHVDETNAQWIQYIVRYAYNYRLQNIERLTVKFDYPFSNCSIPELKLVREKMQDNEFVIAPGV